MNQKSQNKALLALDVGEKRIGIAASDGAVRIARALDTIEVDGSEIEKILQYAADEKAGVIVIGYPRNQSGEPTAQTAYVQSFSDRLSAATAIPLVFQDESLTSVLAEEQLRLQKKPYQKADIDARAAQLILQDYIERNA